ncbi:MATE family efflux transporter [Oceanospirillum linum]|uniref:MATE family efflux transporter n=1 Tax=Oceanospirillum linum TaxID=966 RepID=UPI00089F19BD|nr:MATE family efflux transporter [Oceanospirillum linum]SEF90252.1 putative efflux protein, MATE family [Oleiphilus messinensis]SMP13439.1 putative efflux protein, MATE family [Oceanospirillum linum]
MSVKPSLVSDPIAPLLFRMTFPVMGGIISLMLFNLVDAYFIGMLGTDALAAVTFTFPVTFTLISLSIGLGIGTSAVVGRLLGANSLDLVKRRTTDAALLAIVLSLLLTLVGWLTLEPLFLLLGVTPELMPYIRDYMQIWYLGTLFVVLPRAISSALRASGNTLIPGLVMIGSALLNGILDPLLIFGWGPIPAMGVKGAALATLISWMVLTVCIFLLPQVRKQLLSFERPSTAQVIESWSVIGKIALPAIVSSILTPVSTAILIRIVAQYGNDAVASFGVGSRIEAISLIVVFALSMTLPPFVSQNLGAEKIERVYRGVMGCFIFAIVWQAFIWGVLLMAQNPLVSAFAEPESDLARNLHWFIWLVPMGLGFQGIIILANSTMNALHRPMIALRLSILRLFIFYIPICALGAWVFGLLGIFGGAVVANALMAFVSWWTVRGAIRSIS